MEEGGGMQARAGFDTGPTHVFYVDRLEALEAIGTWMDILRDNLEYAREFDQDDVKEMRRELRAWTALLKAIRTKES